MLAGGAQKDVTLVNALLLAQEAGLKVRGHLGLHASAWCTQAPSFPGLPCGAANAALGLGAIPWGGLQGHPFLPRALPRTWALSGLISLAGRDHPRRCGP